MLLLSNISLARKIILSPQIPCIGVYKELPQSTALLTIYSEIYAEIVLPVVAASVVVSTVVISSVVVASRVVVSTTVVVACSVVVGAAVVGTLVVSRVVTVVVVASVVVGATMETNKQTTAMIVNLEARDLS